MAQQSSHFEFDFFITRAGVDSALAAAVALDLQRAGLRVATLDFMAASPKPISEVLQDLIAKSRHMIFFLSVASQASPYVQAEWQSFVAQDPLQRGKRRLLVFKTDEAQPQGLMRTYVFTDLARAVGVEERRAIVLRSALSLMRDRGLDDSAASASVPQRGRKIFISYRRDASHHEAGRVYDRLELEFSAEEIFFDVHTIPYGVDFREYITDAVKSSTAMVSVISQEWARRFRHRILPIFRKTDYVRMELELALSCSVPILPILLDEAQMPKARQLPKSIRAIAYLNAARVRGGRDFRSDMMGIVETIKGFRAR